MSDKTKESNVDSKKIEVVEVDEDLNADLELGATMFDVDDAKQKLNNTKKESRVVDGESVLESLAESSQIIHVKGTKTIDSNKTAKKTVKSKKESNSEKMKAKKDSEDKESR